jgi:DNA-binding transcriptional LysR family regulator
VQHMNDMLTTLRLIVRIAALGSFSAAGRELGLSQPSSSRLVAALEAEVGIAFFARTTRAVLVTEAGAAYIARVERILAELDEADFEVRGTGELRGKLRVGLNSTFAMREVIPRLPRFIAANPALKVELLIDDRRVDLVAEGIDVAFRSGELPDSCAVARRIIGLPRILVASPGYLARAGRPQVPGDLARHDVILGPTIRSSNLTFCRGDRTVTVRVSGRVAVSQHEAVMTAALTGLGVAVTSCRGCLQDLEEGMLERLLPEWSLGSLECYALFAAGGRAKPSARAFVQFLIDEMNAAGPKTADNSRDCCVGAAEVASRPGIRG